MVCGVRITNILMTTQKGRAGQILGAMFSGRGTIIRSSYDKTNKKGGLCEF